MTGAEAQTGLIRVLTEPAAVGHFSISAGRVPVSADAWLDSYDEGFRPSASRASAQRPQVNVSALGHIRRRGHPRQFGRRA